MSKSQRRNNNRNNKKSFRGKSRMVQDPLLGPPSFNNNPIYHRRLRFESQGAEGKDADTVTSLSMRNLLFAGSSGNTAVGCISAFRLRRVRMWGLASSLTQQYQQLTFTWNDSHGPVKTLTSSGNSVNPGYIDTRPVKSSELSFWFGTLAGSTTLFSLSGPAGTIVDIDFDYQLLDASSNEVASALTTTGTTAGVLYWNSYLDNTAVAGSGAGVQNYLLQQVNTQQQAHT
jgi:hypothetical protein